MSDTTFEILLEQLKCLAPSSRNDMSDSIFIVLEKYFEKRIDSHNTNSVIYMFTTTATKYVLKAEYTLLNNATKKEIIWYSAVPIGAPVPGLVASFTKGGYSFLILPFLEDARSLADLTSAGLLTQENLSSYIEEAVTQDRQIFIRSGPLKVSIEEVDRLYLEKYNRRAKKSYESAYLKQLLHSPEHIVNGKLLYSPSHYLSIVQHNSILHHYLTPETVGFIHGDLHCGNIFTKDKDIYLIDPNGALLMPIEYDYGKILHSIHGGYDQIMENAARLGESIRALGGASLGMDLIEDLIR